MASVAPIFGKQPPAASASGTSKGKAAPEGLARNGAGTGTGHQVDPNLQRGSCVPSSELH